MRKIFTSIALLTSVAPSLCVLLADSSFNSDGEAAHVEPPVNSVPQIRGVIVLSQESSSIAPFVLEDVAPQPIQEASETVEESIETLSVVPENVKKAEDLQDRAVMITSEDPSSLEASIVEDLEIQSLPVKDVSESSEKSPEFSQVAIPSLLLENVKNIEDLQDRAVNEPISVESRVSEDLLPQPLSVQDVSESSEKSPEFSQVAIPSLLLENVKNIEDLQDRAVNEPISVESRVSEDLLPQLLPVQEASETVEESPEFSQVATVPVVSENAKKSEDLQDRVENEPISIESRVSEDLLPQPLPVQDASQAFKEAISIPSPVENPSVVSEELKKADVPQIRGVLITSQEPSSTDPQMLENLPSPPQVTGKASVAASATEDLSAISETSEESSSVRSPSLKTTDVSFQQSPTAESVVLQEPVTQPPPIETPVASEPKIRGIVVPLQDTAPTVEEPVERALAQESPAVAAQETTSQVEQNVLHKRKQPPAIIFSAPEVSTAGVIEIVADSSEEKDGKKTDEPMKRNVFANISMAALSAAVVVISAILGSH